MVKNEIWIQYYVSDETTEVFTSAAKNLAYRNEVGVKMATRGARGEIVYEDEDRIIFQHYDDDYWRTPSRRGATEKLVDRYTVFVRTDVSVPEKTLRGFIAEAK